ncbi:MAG: acetyl-CoA carboxylase biotin carboxylase subunit [Geminicoccaceae bacterium]|nr:acetyl-CoA carboxylase biotin carboxylase subunit [Geminicoccaceae bacterium]
MPPFRKVLIANRGEIALRILRACRELGIQTVAVHSTADAEAMHVRLADESVCIGPPPARDSYLKALSILAAAEITGAEAIHPGYGFLAENADFAQMVVEHGFAFIGPKPEHIRIMGDKIAAKATAQELGLPVVPGTDGTVSGPEEAMAAAAEVGYPLLIKAVAGGGGRGMTVVEDGDGLMEGLQRAQGEARAGFGDDRVYMERFLRNPRHIEVQVFGDMHGNVVHLFERDCSLQRRHQKLVEEAPSPALDDAQRREIGGVVATAMRRLGYLGAGTVEFLYEDGRFFFIEMNTRIQVEHPVTELVTGIDLVKEQIRVAAGHPLSVRQEDVRLNGHAIEVRINAEDPRTFLPAPGLITAFHAPGGPGVRVDAAIYGGYRVPPWYDSLVGKLIVHDHDREACLARLDRALSEFVVEGIPTTIPLLRALLADDDIRSGRYDTGWLGGFLARWADQPLP